MGCVVYVVVVVDGGRYLTWTTKDEIQLPVSIPGRGVFLCVGNLAGE